MREFDTGATRDSDDGKLDYRGFLSPKALKTFAEYMHKHRIQANGELRSGSNWKKGIPTDAYMESMWRHFFDVWDLYDDGDTGPDFIEALCALFFNVQGMLHEAPKTGLDQFPTVALPHGGLNVWNITEPAQVRDMVNGLWVAGQSTSAGSKPPIIAFDDDWTPEEGSDERDDGPNC